MKLIKVMRMKIIRIMREMIRIRTKRMKMKTMNILKITKERF